MRVHFGGLTACAPLAAYYADVRIVCVYECVGLLVSRSPSPIRGFMAAAEDMLYWRAPTGLRGTASCCGGLCVCPSLVSLLFVRALCVPRLSVVYMRCVGVVVRLRLPLLPIAPTYRVG